MNRDQVKGSRVALRLTQPQMAELLRLRGSNADKTIRDWESGAREISGPAAVALEYATQGALDEVMRRVLPEHVVAEAAEDQDAYPELLIRLWRPRFIGAVLPSGTEAFEGSESVPIGADGAERLIVAMWIDDPGAPPGWDPQELLARAAAAFELHMADLDEEFG